MSLPRHMHVGLLLRPADPAATHGQLAQRYLAPVLLAQSAAFDFVFCDGDGDGAGPAALFEPTLMVAALAALTDRIGFVATAATDQHEIYNLARRFASLDVLSAGRMAWHLVAAAPNAAASSAARNAEYVHVVGALWQSWDADAFLYDKAAGQFFAPDKMHVLAHRGTHFTVRGPLNVNPSPQGRPVIAQTWTAASSALAARSAELVFVTGASAALALAASEAHRTLLAAQGRDRARVRVLANVMPRLDSRVAVPGFAGWQVQGTAVAVADALCDAFARGGIDGFTIVPPPEAQGLTAFIAGVVPELQRRGVLRTRYAGSTLRQHLGLLP